MIQQYYNDGYYLAKNIFEIKDINNIKFNVQKIFENRMKYLNFEFQKNQLGLIESKDMFDFFSKYEEDYISCMKAAQNLPEIFQLGVSTKMLDHVKQLGVKFPIFSTKPLFFMNSEHTSKNFTSWKIPAHQDWRSIQGSLNCMICWIALTDITTELGQLEVIPSSHKNGLLPSITDDWYAHISEDVLNDDDFISVPMKAGDALFFSAFLVHRSGHNKSDDFRYSLQFRFNDLNEKTFIMRQYANPYSSSNPQKELLTPKFPTSKDVSNFFSPNSL